jgi:hypothetical protein
MKIKYIGELDDAEEQEGIAALDRICFPSDARPSFVDTHWWVVGDKDNPIAYAAARLCEEDNFVYLARCGVMPEARGQRLQCRLTRARIALAKRIGALGVYTDTAHFNIRSANSLIRAGLKMWMPPDPWSIIGANYWFKRFDGTSIKASGNETDTPV